jgi:ribosomal-protein-alanine N-acetyltransferase
MSHYPNLLTKRLILKPITYKDTEALFNLLTEPEVSLYNNFGDITNKHDVRALIQQDLEHSYLNCGIRWSINSVDNIFLGSCGVHEYDEKKSSATIGYEISAQYWRNGYMFEALTKMIAYLLSEDSHFNVKCIIANTLELNIASIKLLKKLGFKLKKDQKSPVLTFELFK